MQKPATMTRFLAVDLGASGGKCFVGEFSGDGFAMRELHRFAHAGVSCFIPDRSGAVRERIFWNDIGIYAEILEGLRTYQRDVGPVLDGLGVDSWGTDGMLTSPDGDALGHVYGYRDHRLDGMIEEVQARIDPDRLYAITGIHFHPFNLSNQLRWLLTRRPYLLQPGCRFLPIPTLFNYYLGGVTSVDTAWASVTQLMDAQRGCWSEAVLRALEIPSGLLPDIVKPGTVVGALHDALATRLGLNAAPLIAVAAHDTASAFAAAPAANPDRSLIISSGTWSLVGRLIPEPITSRAAMQANFSNEGGIGNTRFLRNCMGSWITQELLRSWSITDGRRMAWAEADRLTADAPPLAALIDPDDAGFYNPPDMDEAVQAYLARTGQPTVRDRGTVLRMVYESLALKYRWINERIGELCGKPSAIVHIVGGGSNNRLLNQFTADALGLPVQAGPKEATAIGNLMTQAMAAGVLADVAEAQQHIRASFPIQTYTPGDRQPWDEAYVRFRRLLT